MSQSAGALGGRIVEARQKAQLSQRDLAQYSGISQATISRIESGDRKPTITEVALLADACGVLVADLHGQSTIAEEVRCAGRTDDGMARELSDYLIYAFSCARRLDELHVPEPR